MGQKLIAHALKLIIRLEGKCLLVCLAFMCFPFILRESNSEMIIILNSNRDNDYA